MNPTRLALVLFTSALLGLSASLSGCASSAGGQQNCRTVNSWGAPVFSCVAVQPLPTSQVEPLLEPVFEPEPEPEPEPQAVLRDDKIELLQTVQFETGEAILLEESKQLLDQVAALLEENPQITKVRIEGHTDSVGRRAANQRLSRRRAAAVRTYLLEKGIDEARLTARGYGQTRPIADNTTEQGRFQNRRVEFTILERSDR